MGYAEALLSRDYGREERSLQKKAKRKGLWGSVGRTLGGLVAGAFTGGLVNPVTLGLITGAGTLAGGALGAAASKTKLKGGTFMQEERASLERELGAFGSKNIVESLKSGVTAGIGQKLKLGKEARAAKAGGATAAEVEKIGRGVSFKEGFKESFVGKGWGKGFTGTGGGTGIKTSAQSIEQIAPDYSEQLHAGTAIKPSVKTVGGEPWQEVKYGGVDPNPRGQNLWSKFKGHVSEELEETGGEFSFENIGDIGDYFKNKARDKRMSRDISIGGTSGSPRPGWFPQFGGR
jgi:hypothetical protein